MIGLRFGAAFIPIYQQHPRSELAAICDTSDEKLKDVGDRFGVKKRYDSFEELLRDETVDAVHIATPIGLHAAQTIAALKAGKHVACAVPMATSIEECRQIVETRQLARKHYMMMETAVYSREYLYVKELRDSGKLGRIQFLRGAHHQDMSGWPDYWQGLPPMHYATHAVGPLLAIADREAEYVSCFGSGRIEESLARKYGSPFAVESALIRLKDSPLSAEVTRSLFETSRAYTESFDVYGDRMSYEWQQLEQERPVAFLGEVGTHTEVPDYARLLPTQIRKFTKGGHGGSHPHLVHEFISSIVERRAPFPNELQAANWTSTGICAHTSAMKQGAIVKLPDFTTKL